jgi:hypothetical protein
LTLGEFGTSDGDDVPCSNTEPHGCNVTLQDVVASDAVMWLTAFAGNFDGANRWRVWDLPIPVSVRMDSWIGDYNSYLGRLKYVQEAYFGLYLDDGTATGKAKPIATWLRFFGAYLDNRGHVDATGVNLTLLPSNDTLTKVAHLLVAPDAVFCGGFRAQRCGDLLRYQSATESVATLGVVWQIGSSSSSSITVQSTEDATAWLNLTALSGARVDLCRVRQGRLGLPPQAAKEANLLELQLLRGEPITLDGCVPIL